MTLKECLSTLNLPASAGLSDVKTAFRKLAFQYHPDLNSDPAAGPKFRKINEAYVNAKEHLKAQGTENSDPKSTASEKPSASRQQGARAYAKQNKQKSKQTASRKTTSSRSRQQSYYYKEEDVLKDILRDPFAKQVFEDIYSQIRKDQPQYKGPLELKKRKLQLHWGDRTMNLDFTKGLGGSIKSWFTGQMDHEQTVYFPAQHLMPGRKIRITVEQAFSSKPKTIEVTLPHDFVVGRPIRLKNLGRKLGPFTGDLLLKIFAK